ncbi:hypothetical protein Tco_0270388 [Tanacetum coccineum]
MTTLAEHMVVVGADNRPPMLDKSMHNSWQSRMWLYIKGKKNGRMMLESIKNGPLVYLTIEENSQIHEKKYAELTEQEKFQDDCDVQENNIVLQVIIKYLAKDEEKDKNMPYLNTLKSSRPLPDFEEYVIDTPYLILWSKIKKNTFSANTLYPKTPILRIQENGYGVLVNTPYPKIRYGEEKAHRRGKVYNWETATYGKIWDNEDVHDLGSVETEFPAIVFNDTLTSEAALSCEPTVSSLNDEIDFKISFDESEDEDCIVIFDKKSFSYKIISVNNLKTDSENDNNKVNMPLVPSPEPTVSYFDDLDYFKYFEKKFPAIVYHDAQTSKLDLLTELILSPQHIDEFNLKDETSFSECDEEEQNVLKFNDLFPFNVIYPDELKMDTDNDNDKVDIEYSSGYLSVKPLPDVINTDVGAYAHGSNKLLEIRPRERKIDDVGDEFTNLEILKCWSLETSRRLFNTQSR